MQWTRDDVICTDKYLAAFPDAYVKTDVFYLRDPVVWRDRLAQRPPHSSRLIVSGHSDFPVVDALADWYPDATWFSVNTQSSRVHGLPLGITNDTDESELHRIYGNVDMMVEVAQTPRQIRNLVYMNFSCNTYPAERVPLWNLLCGFPWVTGEAHTPTPEGRRAFLTSIRNHEFVLCPRGNGIDTHRLWETLYMGSIPIVRADIAHRDWTDLPILIVNDWSDVTEDRLRATRAEFATRTWNWSKLKIGYWVQKIHNESRNHSHGH